MTHVSGTSGPCEPSRQHEARLQIRPVGDRGLSCTFAVRLLWLMLKASGTFIAAEPDDRPQGGDA